MNIPNWENQTDVIFRPNVLVIDYWNLRFICNLGFNFIVNMVLVIWDFNFM